jgi:hypothetical protein
MTTITNTVSIFVQNQFPDFYKNEGPKFIAFLEAYYEWLETEGQAINLSRRLTELRDIDTTLDSFLEYFKTKYLSAIKLTPDSSTRDLVKHAVELYRAKGSSRAVQLLFLLLFDQRADVYFPGQDVLRPSDGTWYIPRYLELSPSDVSFQWPGKSILGTRSGSTALVESVERRDINGKVIDIAYISSVAGMFSTGERIVLLNTGDLTNAPLVVGSVTTIDVVSAGRNFNIGDVVDIESSLLGLGAKARVIETANATGRVDFQLVDGGYGYTSSANVLISEKVLTLNGFQYANSEITTYQFRETLSQQTTNVAFTSPNTVFTVGTVIVGRYANGTTKATGKALFVANTFVVVQNSSGSFTGSALITTLSPSQGAIVTGVTDQTANGIVVGSNSTTVGLDYVTDTFYANALIISNTTNITANITAISTGQDADFDIGLLVDTEQIFINTDLLRANNVSNVAYMTINLNASAYGFPKLPTGNSEYILNEVLNINAFTLGTIASLVGINPGQGYNTNPYVKVIDDNIAPFERTDLLLLLSNTSGPFLVGEDVIQSYTVPTQVIKLNSPSGVYQSLETVRQVQANSNIVLGVVQSYTVSNTTLVVRASEAFDTSNTIVGLTSNASATANNIVAGDDNVSTKGVVVAANSSTITIKRTRFAVSFASGLPIQGDISGVTATVDDVIGVASPVMGNNAVVTSDAGTANGTIKSLEVVDSGLAYSEGELITLTSDSNPFIATGLVRLRNQGKGEGYWTTSRGFLNNKYLHDSDYYQDFSYEVRSGLSLDRYASVLRQVVHVAGTKYFGRVIEETVQSLTPTITSTITTS